jgi:hypothetical protein
MRYLLGVTNDIPVAIDTGRANIARVYDYLLGGKDNYAADRELAEELLAQQPGLRQNARANRAFMQRVVRTVTEAGVDQFLDLGTGLPTGQNVHQVAQSVNQDARIVYVDNDEVVAAHSRALLASDHGAEFILGDLREPGQIVDGAKASLDLSRPVALTLISMLHFVPDDGQAQSIVSVLTEPLASGSYLAISHWQYQAADEDLAKRYSGAVAAIARRTREQIGGLLPGSWEPVEPGLVPVTAWRPAVAELEPASGSGSGSASETGQFVGAVVRKP